MNLRWQALLQRLIPLGGVMVLLLWQMLHLSAVVDPILLPSPGKMLHALWVGMTDGPMAEDFLKTVWRTTLSFVIAAVVSIPLGVLLGANRQIYHGVAFIIDFFRSTPASAVFPLFLVLFGVGDETKILMASFAAGALGYALNGLFLVLEKRLIHWGGR